MKTPTIRRHDGIRLVMNVVTAMFFAYFAATVGATAWFISSSLSAASGDDAGTAAVPTTRGVDAALLDRIEKRHQEKTSEAATLPPAPKNPFRKTVAPDVPGAPESVQ